MKKQLLAFVLGIIVAACGGVIAQSITTLQADKIIANTSLTSPVATIPAITAHGLGNVVSNTALGNSVFNSATTGTGNVGIGSFALQNIGADQQNTAVGVDAFNGCAGSCAYGTAVGWGAGQTQLNGYGTFIGYLAGQGITTGTYNTIVGTSAFNTGSGITTGANNTILGAQVTGLAAGLTNNIILANGTGAIKAQHDGTSWIFTNNISNSRANSGGNNDVISQNSSNTANSGARLIASVAGASSGNPETLFSVAGVQDWVTGIDLADSNAFKISASAALNTTNAFKLTTGGAPSFPLAGGAANAAVCWKADAVTLGHCTSVVAAGGTCTCV